MITDGWTVRLLRCLQEVIRVITNTLIERADYKNAIWKSARLHGVTLYKWIWLGVLITKLSFENQHACFKNVEKSLENVLKGIDFGRHE